MKRTHRLETVIFNAVWDTRLAHVADMRRHYSAVCVCKDTSCASACACMCVVYVCVRACVRARACVHVYM